MASQIKLVFQPKLPMYHSRGSGGRDTYITANNGGLALPGIDLSRDGLPPRNCSPPKHLNPTPK